MGASSRCLLCVCVNVCVSVKEPVELEDRGRV